MAGRRWDAKQELEAHLSGTLFAGGYEPLLAVQDEAGPSSDEEGELEDQLDDSLPVLVSGARMMGRLEAGDEILEDDETFFDAYALEGELGRTVTVVLRAEFDAYLLLIDP